MHALVQKLQQIAKSAGHERPLMIGTDQENGMPFNISCLDRDTNDDRCCQVL